MRRRNIAPRNSIQIAPLVDVMLVLLIVFMSVAPAIVSGIDVNLPNGGSELNGVSKNQFVTITITKTNEVFVEEREVEMGLLINNVKRATNNNKSTTLFVKTDKDVKYGQVINVLTRLSNAGYKNTALVTNVSNTTRNNEL
jgi:biopolymer transport protein TolR